MQTQVVKAGSTARLGKVEGELRAGRNSRIVAESGRRVVVTEGAYFEGPVRIDCDFECKTMRVEGKGFGPSGNVVVRGNLLVHGDMEIDASADISGEVVAERVDIGGHLESKGITSRGVRVGGHMTTHGSLKAGDVDVGGHIRVDGQADITNLRTGGHADLAGGKIQGGIRVRGHFKTSGKLSYGDFQVYGQLTLPAGSRGERLNAFGKVEFEGDGYCKAMEVDGVATVRGNLEAGNLKVNGKLQVDGAIAVSERFEVFGSAEAEGRIECGPLVVGGRLVADRVATTGRADLGGEVWTTRGLKAKEVAVGAGSRVNGPIIGDVIEVGRGVELGGFWAQMSSWRSVGRMTRVDDVYAKEARIDRYSQAKRIYAETIKMQNGSMADEVNYTRGADVSEGVHLEKPPRKLEVLPDAPF